MLTSDVWTLGPRSKSCNILLIPLSKLARILPWTVWVVWGSARELAVALPVSKVMFCLRVSFSRVSKCERYIAFCQGPIKGTESHYISQMLTWMEDSRPGSSTPGVIWVNFVFRVEAVKILHLEFKLCGKRTYGIYAVLNSITGHWKATLHFFGTKISHGKSYTQIWILEGGGYRVSHPSPAAVPRFTIQIFV